MLNRRHLRVKVLQNIYAMHQHESDTIEKQEKQLMLSVDNSLDLFLLVLALIYELKQKEKNYLELASKKHLATKEEKKPSLKFVDNQFFKIIENSNAFFDLLEVRKINNWKNNDDTVLYVLEEVKTSDIYKNYMSDKEKSFQKDIRFIIDIFQDIIAPNEKLYDYLEDHKISWVDDIPVVNTLLLKKIKALKSVTDVISIPKVFKDQDDKDFTSELFRKTVINEIAFANYYDGKTPNWDKDRIAEIDTIILKMAICEFIKFPSIPTKVTINEYLEIAKEYSTPKSSIFINGLLDKLSIELAEKGLIKKMGRGLL